MTEPVASRPNRLSKPTRGYILVARDETETMVTLGSIGGNLGRPIRTGVIEHDDLEVIEISRTECGGNTGTDIGCLVARWDHDTYPLGDVIRPSGWGAQLTQVVDGVRGCPDRPESADDRGNLRHLP